MKITCECCRYFYSNEYAMSNKEEVFRYYGKRVFNRLEFVKDSFSYDKYSCPVCGNYNKIELSEDGSHILPYSG